MYDAVIAKEACSLETQRFVPGEVVSIHRDGTAARNAADKANKRKGEYALFVAVHSESLVKKGDLREDLLNQHELNERREYGKRLMRAILSDELTGKRNVMADDAGYHLQHLGITLEELKEWYEEEVRAEHLEQQIRSQEHAHLRARVRIPRHPATQSALIWPGIPRPSGHLFHGHPAGQSERSDAGGALLV